MSLWWYTMGFSIAQTVKSSALVGRGGVRPVAVDTGRRNQVASNESPPPQATKALVDRKPDTRGLVAKIDVVA